MKIFDCFMFYDEEMLLDIRLNTLDKFIDKFIVVESTFTHSGQKRDLVFDVKKFQKFKEKINYLVVESLPKGIEVINSYDADDIKESKIILNAYRRENHQRNSIFNLLKSAEPNDQVIISDVDEIPNLENINFDKIKAKIFIFKQHMFYYKFNLKLPNLIWSGTEACKKKYLKSPQWLRNIKDKKYSYYRLDAYFSEKKHINVKLIDDGGWHFTNIKTAKEIEHKLKSYLHHREFDINPMTTDEIEKIIRDKKAIYNLNVDKTVSKIGNGDKLEKFPLQKLPKFLQNNLENYKEWID